MSTRQIFALDHTVLFVDDESCILNSIQRTLQNEQYELLVTTDPLQALVLIEKHHPSVVISDLAMPAMDGITFLQKAKAFNDKMVGMILSAHSDSEHIMAAINQGSIWRYIIKPWDSNDLKIAVRNALELAEKELNSRLECYQALAELAEIRDGTTGRHLMRIGFFSRLLGEKLGGNKKFCRDLEAFAPLHDIGKVGIPDKILLSERKLSAEEFEVMKTHSVLGYEILKDKPAFAMGAEIAYSHHERYDGSGYPRRLRGEAIPLSARIVAVADVYDALRQCRPYKAPWPHDKARDFIIKSSHSHFDPDIIDAFTLQAGQFAEFSELYFQEEAEQEAKSHATG